MVDKRSNIKNALRGFAIFCVTYLVYKLMISPFHSNNVYKNNKSPIDTNFIYTALQTAVDSINTHSNFWIDSITEFKNALVLPNKTLQYNYVLKIDTNKYNIRKIKELDEKNLFDNFIKTSSCKTFRDSSVTIIYNYTDIKMNALYKIVFSPDKYK